MKKSIATLLAAALLQFPGFAAAQSPEELAQEYFDDGAAHYVSGEYARAIVDFRKAFSHVENPIFLYNIALAERNLGQCEAAIGTASRAIEMTGTDSATSSRSKGVIAGCRVRLAAVEAAETKPTAEAVAGVEKSDETGGESGFESGGTGDAQSAEPSGMSGWSIAGWSLGAVGLSALVAGGVIGAQLDGTYDEYQTTTDPTVQDEALDELETMRPVALGLIFTGAALAATGIVILAFDIGSGSESASINVSPHPTHPAISLSGRF